MNRKPNGEAVVKVKIQKVWINRAEGPVDSCGAKIFEGDDALRLAQRQMADWGITAPDPGDGYNKCDFVVEYEDGETYAGRYDLQSTGYGDDGQTIGGQMRQQLRFVAGDWRPAWCNDKEWDSICERHKGEKEDALDWLENRELGIVPLRPVGA